MDAYQSAPNANAEQVPDDTHNATHRKSTQDPAQRSRGRGRRPPLNVRIELVVIDGAEGQYLRRPSRRGDAGRIPVVCREPNMKPK